MTPGSLGHLRSPSCPYPPFEARPAGSTHLSVRRSPCEVSYGAGQEKSDEDQEPVHPGTAKLSTYRRKRDFEQTPEPSGVQAGARRRDGRASWCSGTGPARLHYDFRLEIDGVLVSWAVPKGVTLDPKVAPPRGPRRGPPARVLRLRGCHPGRRVRRRRRDRVGPRHVGAARRRRRARRRSTTARSTSTCTARSCAAAFVLVRTGDGRPRRQGAVARAAQARRRRRSRAGIPRTIRESVHQRAHQRRGRGGARARVDASTASDAGAPTSGADVRARRTDDELAALDALGAKGDVGRSQGRELALTNLDKVLFPARGDDEAPVTKRDLDPLLRVDRADAAAPTSSTVRSTSTASPTASTSKGFWQKQAPKYAPEWIPRWHNDEADRARARSTSSPTAPPALGVAREPRRDRAAPVDVTHRRRRAADVRADRHRPGHRRPRGTSCSRSPGCTAPRSSTSVCAATRRRRGQRGIQIWVPIEPGLTFDETRAWVEQLSRVDRAGRRELVSWSWEKQSRGGRARLDYTQNAINKTLVAPYSVRAAPGAPVSMPITWDELDDPDLRPDRWTIRDRAGPPRRRRRPHGADAQRRAARSRRSSERYSPRRDSVRSRCGHNCQ